MGDSPLIGAASSQEELETCISSLESRLSASDSFFQASLENQKMADCNYQDYYGSIELSAQSLFSSVGSLEALLAKVPGLVRDRLENEMKSYWSSSLTRTEQECQARLDFLNEQSKLLQSPGQSISASIQSICDSIDSGDITMESASKLLSSIEESQDALLSAWKSFLSSR